MSGNIDSEQNRYRKSIIMVYGDQGRRQPTFSPNFDDFALFQTAGGMDPADGCRRKRTHSFYALPSGGGSRPANCERERWVTGLVLLQVVRTLACL